jgi:hypothetical protein
MTDSSAIDVRRYSLRLTDKHGDILVLTDEDGGPFYTEESARARVADAEASNPGYKAQVCRTIAVDFDDGRDVPNTALAHCPAELPGEMLAAFREAGQLWRRSPSRPRVAPQVLASWGQLIDKWIGDDRLPLLVRKQAGTRGQFISHDTGRVVIPVDNTPAHWSMGLALSDQCPAVSEIKGLFDNDAFPVAILMTKAERTAAKLTGGNADWIGLLSHLGWKVCHSHEVGLRTRTKLQHVPIGLLQDHFRALVDPANMFLVPLRWAGFGELPEVRAIFAKA